MMNVLVAFNTEQDEAIIRWDFRHGHSIPADPLNIALSQLYSRDLKPWVYVWWDQETREQQGILLSEAQDLALEEVDAIANRIVSLAGDIDMPEGWEATEYEVDA